MLKAFGKLWLKGAKRVAAAQRAQQKKILKSLLPAPPKPRAKAVKRPLAVTARPVTAATGAAPLRVLRKAAAPRKATAPRKVPAAVQATISTHPGAGGSWTRAFHVAPDTAGARRLTYWLYVPATAADAAPMPLVIMLHGCGQDAVEFASGTGMNRLAARHGFAVLYPQQSLSAHPQRCWPWYRRALQHGAEEVALIAGLTETLLVRHAFERRRVYVAGLSAGAALAQTLAVCHPHLIAAVGSHSGPAFGLAHSRTSAFTVMQHASAVPMQPVTALLAETPDFPVMPIMIIQGAQDPVVRPVNGAVLARQFCGLNHLGSDSAPVILDKAARGKRDGFRTTDYRRGSKTLVRMCEVTHLGHAWSGGDPALRYNAAKGPEASVLLWDFFKRHRRLKTSRPR